MIGEVSFVQGDVYGLELARIAETLLGPAKTMTDPHSCTIRFLDVRPLSRVPYLVNSSHIYGSWFGTESLGI